MIQKLLNSINHLYHSVDNLSSQLAHEGQRLYDEFESFSQRQQENHNEITRFNRQQSALIQENNKLLENQNITTNMLLFLKLHEN